MPDVKTCNLCKRELAIEQFEKRYADPSRTSRNAEGSRRGTCRMCRRHRAEDEALFAQAKEGGEKLLSIASPAQAGMIETLLSKGSIVAAADSLGILPHQLRGHLQELSRKAAQRGWSPTHDIIHPIPPGYRLRGTSTKYGADGKISEQWHKTERVSDDQMAILLEAAGHLTDAWPDELKPMPVEAPKDLDSDLLAVYPMGDPHLGLLAWRPETGEHFDLKIAERQLYAAADHLVSIAPDAETGLLINAGDFFHADNDKNTTYKGTPVDTDGRYPLVYKAGILLMRRLIDRMLQKHKRVHVINEIGNHDTTTSILLSIMLDALYSNEPRVHVDTSPEPFHWFRFGKVLIGTHHGDLVRHRELGEVMACDRPEDWGATKHRHFYVGHVHHDTVKELRGVTVETLRTLAAKDKWHHGQGYRSGRDMKLDVWHRDYGYKGRHVIDISLVKALSGDAK